MKKDVLIYCNCGAGIIPKAKQNEIAGVLRKTNTDVIELRDLCAYSINEKAFLGRINANFKRKWIIACYPRAVINMFRQNNVAMDNFEVLNFRVMSVRQIKVKLDENLEQDNTEVVYGIKKNALKVPAWYPVVDKSRCVSCGKCARLCVFDVYRFSKENLEVVRPLLCKNNGSACARICPVSAIIFPRLSENSFLSGAEGGRREAKND